MSEENSLQTALRRLDERYGAPAEPEINGVSKPDNCDSDLARVFDGSVVSGMPFCGDQHIQVQVVECKCHAICLKRRV